MKAINWKSPKETPRTHVTLLVAVETQSDKIILEGVYKDEYLIWINEKKRPVYLIGTVKGWMYKSDLGFPQ